MIPVLGRNNALEIFERPESDIYVTLLKRIALHFFGNAPRADPPPGAIAIDTHVHTCYSPDSLADVSQMLRAAADRGLSGVAITDHDTIEGALKAQEVARRLIRQHKLPGAFFVIQGEEVSSSDGHIIGLFLSQEIRAGMSAAQTIRAIHAQGGIAVAAHPLLPHSLGNLANTLPFDAVETMNAAEKLHYASLGGGSRRRRSAFYEVVTKPRLGASDAHDPYAVAECYTLVNCASTPEAVRAAMLAGQTTAVASVSDEDERSALKHGLPRLLAIYESATDPSPLLRRLTHTDDISFTLLPHPVLRWTREF